MRASFWSRAGEELGVNDGTATCHLVRCCFLSEGGLEEDTFGGLASSLSQRAYCLLESAARAKEPFSNGIMRHFEASRTLLVN